MIVAWVRRASGLFVELGAYHVEVSGDRKDFCLIMKMLYGCSFEASRYYPQSCVLYYLNFLFISLRNGWVPGWRCVIQSCSNVLFVDRV